MHEAWEKYYSMMINMYSFAPTISKQRGIVSRLGACRNAEMRFSTKFWLQFSFLLYSGLIHEQFSLIPSERIIKQVSPEAPSWWSHNAADKVKLLQPMHWNWSWNLTACYLHKKLILIIYDTGCHAQDWEWPGWCTQHMVATETGKAGDNCKRRPESVCFDKLADLLGTSQHCLLDLRSHGDASRTKQCSQLVLWVIWRSGCYNLRRWPRYISSHHLDGNAPAAALISHEFSLKHKGLEQLGLGVIAYCGY